MDYPIYQDINHKRFKVLNAPESLIEEYDSWDGSDLDFIKKFYPWIGSLGCEAKLSIERCEITKLANNNNIRVKKEFSYLSNMSNYSYSNFIKKPNKKVAYIMGFLWADGSVGAKKWEDRHDNKIVLAIKKEDFLKIKEIFEESANWSFYDCVRGGNRKDRLDAIISDISLKQFFYEMDYHKKSNSIGPTKILNFLGDDLESHFVRGWFDGDGSFYNYKKRIYDNRATFTSNKDENWDALTRIYDRLKIKYGVARTDHSSHVIISNESGFYKLFEYMYKDDDGVFLPRKKDRFQKYFDRMAAKKLSHSSQYRGVTKLPKKRIQTWVMQFRSRFAPKKVVKYFNNELDAAREYDRLALKYIGEKAHTNFNYE